MMREQECPHGEDAAAYALGALDAAERAEFEAHLRVCSPCRDQVAKLEESAAWMAWTLPPAEPPAGLKARVLDRVRAEAREAAGRRGALAPRLPVWAAAAMIALAMLSAALGWRTYELSAQVARLQRDLAARGDPMVALRTVALAGTEAAPAAKGRVTLVREGETVRVMLDAAGLPPLQGGQSYQLWLIQDGRRENGGTFVVDSTGRGGVTRVFPATLRFSAVGVTREPDSFGTAPRGQRVMGGQG